MSKHTPTKALSELVDALNATTWSSWQTTAKFSPALAAAQEALDRERLIAAAPELLEALKDLLDHYTSLVNSGDAGNWDAENEGEVIAARAAIAKAQGETA